MVKLQKIVKKIGSHSLGILFTRDERKIIGLKRGSKIQVDVEKIKNIPEQTFAPELIPKK